MSSTETDRLHTILFNFGLEEEEVKIFEFLLQNGPSTASQISKGTSIPRTTVYRLIEKLVLTQLVKELVTSQGKAFEAGNVQELKIILQQREDELSNLKNSFKELEKITRTMATPEIAKTKILSYKGLDGLKQMTWNSKNAKNELRIIEKSTMSQFLDYGFSERARTEFLLNKIQVKEITNEKEIPAWTEIKQFVTDYWKCKYIPSSLFEVKFEILIYNDVYAMYNYENNDIVGVEIYNKQLADMQRQLFDFLWSNGQELKKLNDNGKSSL
jgi:sugar-specific transcriptional regulator TrmB